MSRLTRTSLVLSSLVLVLAADCGRETVSTRGGGSPRGGGSRPASPRVSAARELLREGTTRAALREIRRAMDEDPSDAEAGLALREIVEALLVPYRPGPRPAPAGERCAADRNLSLEEKAWMWLTLRKMERRSDAARGLGIERVERERGFLEGIGVDLRGLGNERGSDASPEDAGIGGGTENGAGGNPTEPPSSGVFFDDGADEDLRARAEGRFDVEVRQAAELREIDIRDLLPHLDSFPGADVRLRSGDEGAAAPGNRESEVRVPYADTVTWADPRGWRRRDGESRTAGDGLDGARALPGSTSGGRFASGPRSGSGLGKVTVGEGKTLEVVRIEIRVTVEGHRARTEVEHVFRNPFDRRLEGTFFFPLPACASLAGFAMSSGFGPRAETVRGPAEAPPDLPGLPFVPRIAPPPANAGEEWGEVRSARVARRDTAARAYEETTRRRVDPGLLEKVEGNFFRGRLFPIEARGLNRVVIAYEEDLLPHAGRMAWRFPLPDLSLERLLLSLQARAQDLRDASFEPKAVREERDGTIAFAASWEGKGPGGEAVFSFAPADPGLQVLSGRDQPGGELYFHARIALPEAEGQTKAGSAVFLVDTSASSRPDRHDASCALLSAILEGDPTIERFQVLTFDAGARFAEGGGEFWIPNTPPRRKAVLESLESEFLEGGTNLSAALERLKDAGGHLRPGEGAAVFLLSDGQANLGETRAEALAEAAAGLPFPARFYAYWMGIGRENSRVFDALSSRGGGTFPCLSPDDLAAAAVAHRTPHYALETVACAGGAEVKDLVIAGGLRDVPSGGTIVLCGRAAKEGRIRVVLGGRRGGRAFELPVELALDGRSSLAPRAFGETVVAELDRAGNPAFEDLIVAYGQRFGIGSGAASFLILESDQDYKRFGIEEGLSASGLAEASTLEILKGRPATVSEADRWASLLAKAPLSHDRRTTLLALLQAIPPEAWAEPPALSLQDGPTPGGIPASYRECLDAEDPPVRTIMDEAERRAQSGRRGSAVRALTTLLDLRAGEFGIRESVAWRLLDRGEAALALPLMIQAIEDRPYEPQPWLELARLFADRGNGGPAVLCYEVLCRGDWDGRFFKVGGLAAEEYRRFLLRARGEGRTPSIPALAREAIGESLGPAGEPPIGVTITWNTDNTDVDLWVIEPTGERVFYEHRNGRSGSTLSEDVTRGYGPERYSGGNALEGEYRVMVHYYAGNENRLGGGTDVRVLLEIMPGTGSERRATLTVRLEKGKEEREVFRIRVSADGSVSGVEMSPAIGTLR